MNLSRNKVAKLTGVSLSMLQAWEIGEREASVTHLAILAKILQTKMTVLFGEQEQRQQDIYSVAFLRRRKQFGLSLSAYTSYSFIFVARIKE